MPAGLCLNTAELAATMGADESRQPEQPTLVLEALLSWSQWEPATERSAALHL